MKIPALTLQLLLLTLIVGCSGSGGGGGAAPPSPGTNSPAPSVPDPAQSWDLARAAPESVGVAAADVDRLLNHLDTDAAVQSVMLVKNGRIVGERYAAGMDAETSGTSWSVAKSFYAAALGAALDEGLINSLDDPASNYLVEWQGTEKATITLRQLLEMRGGLPDANIFVQNDQTAYALSRDTVATPGSQFIYSNPTSQLLEPLLRRTTGLSAHEYLATRILAPIGIDTNGVGFWLDPTGTQPLTYCCLDMKPADFARFGLLFARGGQWEGTQVLSRDFVEASLRAQTSLFYGLHWWVLNPRVSAAQGLDGQKIYVWPAADLVLVVLTRYSHFQNQGHVLSLTNFPATAAASFDQDRLLALLNPLGP